METSKFFNSIIKRNYRDIEEIGRRIDVNVPLNLKGSTALHIAAEFIDELDASKVCQILLQLGADVNKVDCFGITALHVAAQNGNEHTLDYLVKRGGNVLKCDNDGHTVHYHAYKNNQLSIMEYLSNLINTNKLHEKVLDKKFSYYLLKVEKIKIPVFNIFDSNSSNSMEEYCSCDSHCNNQKSLKSSRNNSHFSVPKNNSVSTRISCMSINYAALSSYSLFSTITYMSAEINAHCNSYSSLTEGSSLISSSEGNGTFPTESDFIFPSMSSDYIIASNDDNSDSFVTVVEEFLYEDLETDIRLIERRCPGIASLKNSLNKIDNKTNSTGAHISNGEDVFYSEQDSINSLASSILFMSENCLKSQLASLGFSAGPVTPSTIHTLHRHLMRLRKHPDKLRVQGKEKTYAKKLHAMLRNIETVDWTAGDQLEDEMSQPFNNPKISQSWRCGITKTSFDYILLDPRVTANLNSKRPLTPTERFNYFISSIFYIGKGTSTRPYFHLHEAASVNCSKNVSAKTKNIQNIWDTGYGVISLHVFQNIIPAEACTREAAMISALGIENLTNVIRGSYYGPAGSWTKSKQKLLGSFLLYKAFNILIFEGERQIRPQNLQTFRR